MKLWRLPWQLTIWSQILIGKPFGAKHHERAMTSTEYVLARQATDYIKSILPETIPLPQLGVICGSGLNSLVSTFSEPQLSLPYVDIPNFPVSTITGHESRLVFGTLGKKRTPIVAMVGRVHFYEGYDMSRVGFPIRVLCLLGIKILIGLYSTVTIVDS